MKPLEQKTPAGKESDRELHIARCVQSAMNPLRFPPVDGLDCATLYLPSARIGGDLFDVIQLSEDMLAIIMFDVADNGVSAALISALAKISFANHVRLITPPRIVMERVNQDLIKSVHTDYYLTALVAYLDLHNNQLTYCNAAHPYPIIYRRTSGTLEHLASTGVCVGIFEHAHYEDKSLYLNSGDWLTLFTDGIYHVYAKENELAGRRLFEQEILAATQVGSPQALVSRISEASCTASPLGPIDDVTVVGIEFLSQSRKNQIKLKLGFSENDPVYLQVISYFEEMDKAAAIILGAMDTLGYADESIRKMKIILTELFANAIYHGNNGDHTKRVTIGHVIDRKKVLISIMDEGAGFDPQCVPDPTLPENLVKDCGRGLYIVKNYADLMEFNDKGNRVTITKYHVTR